MHHTILSCNNTSINSYDYQPPISAYSKMCLEASVVAWFWGHDSSSAPSSINLLLLELPNTIISFWTEPGSNFIDSNRAGKHFVFC